MDSVYQILITIVTSAVAWYFGKLKTKREKNKLDLDTIQNATAPFIKSIQELTKHNQELVSQLIAEQQTSLERITEISELKQDRASLYEKVDCLGKKVDKLTKVIDKLRKDGKDNTTTD